MSLSVGHTPQRPLVGPGNLEYVLKAMATSGPADGAAGMPATEGICCVSTVTPWPATGPAALALPFPFSAGVPQDSSPSCGCRASPKGRGQEVVTNRCRVTLQIWSRDPPLGCARGAPGPLMGADTPPAPEQGPGLGMRTVAVHPGAGRPHAAPEAGPAWWQRPAPATPWRGPGQEHQGYWGHAAVPGSSPCPLVLSSRQCAFREAPPSGARSCRSPV